MGPALICDKAEREDAMSQLLGSPAPLSAFPPLLPTGFGEEADGVLSE